MKLIFRRILVVFGFVIGLNIILLYLFNIGIICNISRSMPKGLYLLYPISKIRKGDIVVACINNQYTKNIIDKYKINESGRCRVGLGVIKYVYGLPGDLINIRESGVSINSELVNNTRLIFHSSAGINYKSNYTIPKDQIFLLSNIANDSIDSRYFGTINIANVKAKAIPLNGKNTVNANKLLH